MRFLTTQEELEALLWICFSLGLILLIFGRKKKVDEKIIKKIDQQKKSEISEISKMSTKLMSKILTFSEFSKISEKKIAFHLLSRFSHFSEPGICIKFGTVSVHIIMHHSSCLYKISSVKVWRIHPSKTRS